MKRFHQQSISFIMTAIYLLITISPLASIGTHSKPFQQTLSKECSGDCRRCGCAAERSASRACCCWQKKLAEERTKPPCEDHNSCPTASTLPAAKVAGNCCSKLPPAGHVNDSAPSVQTDSAPKNDVRAISISTCPCGSGKDLLVISGEQAHHIPARFISGMAIGPATQLSFRQPEQLASRHGEPPDPPPKVFIIS